MPNEAVEQETDRSVWLVKQVYAMAGLCLIVGLAIGYLFRGSQSPVLPAPSESSSQPAAIPNAMGGRMPTIEQMKQMADKKAAPLLEKLKSDRYNSDLIIEVGKIYNSTHQFKEAAGYYDKALQVTPNNVAIRTEMASCLYYSGDVDGAISQLQQSLRYDPKDANSLFNLGMVKWQGKKDGKGALAAWQLLLKSNPQLSADRKATVEKLMADIQMGNKN
jgi:cytochrome c-type biogenesis protein CcmH/NrfG